MDSLLRRIKENLKEIAGELEEKISKEFRVVDNATERNIREFYACAMVTLGSPLRIRTLTYLHEIGVKEMGNLGAVCVRVAHYIRNRMHIPLKLAYEVTSEGLKGIRNWGYITGGEKTLILKEEGVYRGNPFCISQWIVRRLEERLTN
ncbi:MAG TPA: hypothetical protein ENF51_01270 [Candidatus Aenigmarchaeota archaeon]|nr:hypothetical protein [Candidatus Aenigmarchaeota archaeon]